MLLELPILGIDFEIIKITTLRMEVTLLCYCSILLIFMYTDLKHELGDRNSNK